MVADLEAAVFGGDAVVVDGADEQLLRLRRPAHAEAQPTVPALVQFDGLDLEKRDRIVHNDVQSQRMPIKDNLPKESTLISGFLWFLITTSSWF